MKRPVHAQIRGAPSSRQERNRLANSRGRTQPRFGRMNAIRVNRSEASKVTPVM